MNTQTMSRISFIHPVTGRQLDVMAPGAAASELLQSGRSPESLSELMRRIHDLPLPLEVRYLLEGLLPAEVMVDRRPFRVGMLFLQDMLDTVGDYPDKHVSHVLGAYVGFALADRPALRWVFALALSSLFMFLNLDPGFYRKVNDDDFSAAVRERQERLFGALDGLGLKER